MLSVPNLDGHTDSSRLVIITLDSGGCPVDGSEKRCKRNNTKLKRGTPSAGRALRQRPGRLCWIHIEFQLHICLYIYIYKMFIHSYVYTYIVLVIVIANNGSHLESRLRADSDLMPMPTVIPTASVSR